ncbi:MAG: type II toxin-antitoxin system RelE/ParE family toxin [Candidatus Brockarchaeota archaeon]|nr:type II toxin-antitoxin system RelE/ParE family toxin [Candidatus Brockarchaeota archaeon]MBO3842028.1 type II toxin-antitoxin system RelE/ParE family toxin [Candidatus Brockarchaeota archaeon]
MPFKVVLTRQALKGFEKLPPKIKQRVSEALDVLVRTPVPFKSFDVNKLKDYRNTYVIRVSRWKIVYEYD